MKTRAGHMFIALAVLGLAACGGQATPIETVTAVPLPEAAATGPSSTPLASSDTTAPSPNASSTGTPSTASSPFDATPSDAPADPAATSVPDATSPTAPRPAASDEDLPGEPIDFGPAAGTTLAVIGVAHDDHLNLRAGPGTDQEVVARMAPTEDDVVSRGATRTLPAFWYQVEVDGTIGWASARFLAQLGRVDDITATVVVDTGTRPTAGSMQELGRTVAESQASSEEGGSRLVMVVAPSETGDVGEVTWDVVGLADDSVRGLRLHVFGTPTEMGFSLDAVEQTLLCDRGVADDGTCT